jgi:hypothetical protein
MDVCGRHRLTWNSVSGVYVNAIGCAAGQFMAAGVWRWGAVPLSRPATVFLTKAPGDEPWRAAWHSAVTHS